MLDPLQPGLELRPNVVDLRMIRRRCAAFSPSGAVR